MSKPKTRWTRDFKLQALSRMEQAGDVTALARELGLNRELLYHWRRKYRAGGAEALHPIGRPLNVVRYEARAPSCSPAAGDGQRRIEELERKIGQQQLDLDFFRAALRRVRETRQTTGVPGETPSSR